MDPWLSPGRFLLGTASDSFEEGSCGLPRDEQAAKERRTVYVHRSGIITNVCLSTHYLQNNSSVLVPAMYILPLKLWQSCF